jgi:hypothetical protein
VLLDELEAEKSRHLETLRECHLDVVREREPYLEKLADALYGPRANAASAAIAAARELVGALAVINQANDAIRMEGGVAPSVQAPVDPKELADELKWIIRHRRPRLPWSFPAELRSIAQCARVGRQTPSINNKRMTHVRHQNR